MKNLPFEMTCSHCGKLNTHASETPGSDGRAPKDGDACMCITCGKFSIVEFDAPGNVRVPTDQEKHELGSTRDVVKMIVLWNLQQVMMKEKH